MPVAANLPSTGWSTSGGGWGPLQSPGFPRARPKVTAHRRGPGRPCGSIWGWVLQLGLQVWGSLPLLVGSKGPLPAEGGGR